MHFSEEDMDCECKSKEDCPNYEQEQELSPKEFLKELRDNLSPEDYLDFLEALADDESFSDLDQDMQGLVLDYINLPAFSEVSIEN